MQVCLPKIAIGTNKITQNYDCYPDDGITVYYHSLLKDLDIQVSTKRFLGFSWLEILNKLPITEHQT